MTTDLRRIVFKILALAAIVIFGYVREGVSQWPVDPRVNVAITTAPGYQYPPVMVPDGSGGAIIAWRDYRDNKKDLYIQRVDAGGKIRWAVNGVFIPTVSRGVNDVAMVCDSSNGTIITWHDFHPVSIYSDIYTQRVNSNGDVLWTSGGVAICTGGYLSSPALGSDNTGEAIIAWRDKRHGNWDIYAQRVNEDGEILWSLEGVTVCTTVTMQSAPSLTGDGAEGAIITWKENADIHAQRVDSSGSVLWVVDGVAISTAHTSQSCPVIVKDGSGGAIIAWEDNRNDNCDIYAQRIDGSGAVSWITDGIAVCTATDDQSYPSMINDGSGGAIITWQDNRNGNLDIYAQRIGDNGMCQWTADGITVTTAEFDQSSPVIVSDDSGGAIIAWEDWHVGTEDIYAQRMNGNGQTLWAQNGVAISTAWGDQHSPAIIGDGSGGAILAWNDVRNAVEADLYAQQVGSNGLLGQYTSIDNREPDDEHETPRAFRLHQNYPNPFNSRTNIRFELGGSSHTTLRIYNITVQQIRQLMDDVLQAGEHEVYWDGKDDSGHEVSSGLYIFQIETDRFVQSKKALLLR
jgi:hypothetical protein